MEFTEADNFIYEKYKNIRKLLRKQKARLRQIDELKKKMERGVKKWEE